MKCTLTTKKRVFSDENTDALDMEFGLISHEFQTEQLFRTEFRRLGSVWKRLVAVWCIRPNFRPKYVSDEFQTILEQTLKSNFILYVD
jgi:hypothetical protein